MDGEGRKRKMEKKMITKRGSYGRIQVTIPMDTIINMMQWHQNSGLRKAEFFRFTLMIGVCQLAESVKAKRQNENYLANAYNQPMLLPGYEEDTRIGKLEV